MVTITEQGTVTTKLINPFPGLRPFHPDEAHLFFGREGQSEEVLANLARNKFAAVLGASGTGKSSLIYCGLLPTLYGGFLHNGRSKWKIIVTRPGLNPTNNLAYSIAETLGDKNDPEKIETDSLINMAVLRRSTSGISNVIKQYEIGPKDNVLILVDQFEELFRYQFSGKNKDAANQSDHFINLLVDTVKQTELPIYVVVTMRSDFIGDCSPFQEFTRLINDSHYLIPRMTRDDYREAIVGPVAVGGAKITEQLIQLLLNEMGNNQDELPILQHAMMRTWNYWMSNCDRNTPIGISEYEAIGRMERALSNHANEAYDELSVDEKSICEVLFRSLTEKGEDNRGIRRPTSIEELSRITESTEEKIKNIVEVFRKKGRTFLTPAPGIELHSETMIDISHESLMRVWDKLKVWVEEEAAAVKMYQRLSESADQFHQGKTGLWGPPDLQLAINWREKRHPNLAWASRFNPAFERTMVYLRNSEEEYIAEEENKVRLQKRALRRSRIVALVLGTAGMISIALGILALVQRQDALNAQKEAESQREEAKRQAEEAKRQSFRADSSAQVATVQRDSAEYQKGVAETQSIIAKNNEEMAKKQENIANEKSIEAQKQQKRAEDEAENARKQKELAVQASQEAARRRMLSIAQSMAVKSEQNRTDTLLKGLLAFQAYSYNMEYKGLNYDPDIYKAVYSGIKYFKEKDFNLYKGHTGIVRSIIQSGDYIYSGGSDGQIIRWNTEDKTPTILVNNLSIVKKVIMDGQNIIGLFNNGVVSYNTQTQLPDIFSTAPLDIKDMYVTADNKYIVVYNQSVTLTDDYKKAGAELYKTEAKINAANFDKSTGSLFLALSDGKILCWTNLKSNEDKPFQLASVPESNWGDISYNPRKNIVAAGFGNSQGTVYLWNLSTKQQIRILRGHTGKITSISFSSNGNYMATASYDNSLRVWNINDLNTLPVVINDSGAWITSAIFTKDDNFILTGDKIGDIRKYPVNAKVFVDEYCQYLTRTLTEEEWKNYVGEDIPYNPNKCNN